MYTLVIYSNEDNIYFEYETEAEAIAAYEPYRNTTAELWCGTFVYRHDGSWEQMV